MCKTDKELTIDVVLKLIEEHKSMFNKYESAGKITFDRNVLYDTIDGVYQTIKNLDRSDD